MSADEPLLPRIGKLRAALDAVDLVRMAEGLGEPDLDRFDEVPEDLIDLIAAQANLSALLTRIVVGLQRRAGSATASGGALLRQIGDDQHVRAAREELDDFDGWPFDA